MRRVVFIGAFMTLAILACCWAVQYNEKLIRVEREAYLSEQTRLIIDFRAAINKARDETVGPCGKQLVMIVNPPEGLVGHERAVVLMGVVINEIDPTALRLTAKSDGTVELWAGTARIGGRLSPSGCMALWQREK